VTAQIDTVTINALAFAHLVPVIQRNLELNTISTKIISLFWTRRSCRQLLWEMTFPVFKSSFFHSFHVYMLTQILLNMFAGFPSPHRACGSISMSFHKTLRTMSNLGLSLWSWLPQIASWNYRRKQP